MDFQPQTEDALRQWRQQRNLYQQVVNHGKRVRSIGTWYAWDEGDGVVTEGAFTCVVIAHADNKNGVLAHIAADRKPTEEKGSNSFPTFVDALVSKGIKTVDLFGLSGKLFQEIKKYLEERKIHVIEHENADTDTSFLVVIKNNALNYIRE